MLIGILLARIEKGLLGIAVLVGMIFLIHLFVDMIPLKWEGFANIYISLVSINY